MVAGPRREIIGRAANEARRRERGTARYAARADQRFRAADRPGKSELLGAPAIPAT